MDPRFLGPISDMMFRTSARSIRRPLGGLRLRSLHVESIGRETITLGGVVDKPVTFRQLFLRDAAREEHSVDPSTTQKRFSTGQLAEFDVIKEANARGDKLEVVWNDRNRSTFDLSFLKRYANQSSRMRYRRLDSARWKPWTNGAIEPLRINYDEYMQDDTALLRTLEALELDGLVFIDNVPERPNQDGSGPITVAEIARRVGYVKDTFYGPTWDVESVPEAKNVAYTSVYLPLHMDLCYYESPPGIQLLHVIENSTKGGESVFADAYAAALAVLRTDPEAYDALTKVPVTFHYVNDNQHYYYSRPTIVENLNGSLDPDTNRRPISHFNYSPPFQGPLDAIATVGDDAGAGFSDSTVAAFMRGLRAFEAHIEDQRNQFEAKTPVNTCMLFQNRRTLHGRREFTSDSGRRWFKGTYLDIDSFQSKLRVLADGINK